MHTAHCRFYAEFRYYSFCASHSGYTAESRQNPQSSSPADSSIHARTNWPEICPSLGFLQTYISVREAEPLHLRWPLPPVTQPSGLPVRPKLHPVCDGVLGTSAFSSPWRITDVEGGGVNALPSSCLADIAPRWSQVPPPTPSVLSCWGSG